MMNSTHFSHFKLSAYFDTGPLKYLYFLIVLCLYVLIIVSNVLLIVIICVNRSLHEPMYLFLCSLFVNELYGSTGLYPFLLIQILSDVHTVPVSLCFLQIFCLYTYAKVELMNLAVMAYDRYVSICFPLQYHTRMTSGKVALLTFMAWFVAYLAVLIVISLSLRLQLCGNTFNKVYCNNFAIVKLACSDTRVNNFYGLFSTVVALGVPFALIFFSYIRILKVCFSGSKDTRHKAVSTCTPHLISILNFTFGCVFEVIQSRFNMSNVHSMVRIFISLYFITCQPILNPLLYGLKLSKIRLACRNMLFRLSHKELMS